MWSYRLASRWGRFRHASSWLAFRKCLQHRCKHQKISRSICNGVANAGKFFEALATPLQTPESFSWHLQHRCKHQKVFRGICNTVASAKKFFVALATPLQTPKKISGHLQHCCKRFLFREPSSLQRALPPIRY